MGGGDGSAGGPVEAEPFDEGTGPGARGDRHAVLDRLADGRGVTPVGRHEAGVLRCGAFGVRHGGEGRQGGAQQVFADVEAVRLGQCVVDVEDVEQQGPVGAGAAPPGEPGEQPVPLLGDPHPLGASPPLVEVGVEFRVEGVGQAAEEVEFRAPGEGTHGEGFCAHGRGFPVRALGRPGTGSGRVPGPGEDERGCGTGRGHDLPLLFGRRSWERPGVHRPHGSGLSISGRAGPAIGFRSLPPSAHRPAHVLPGRSATP